MPSRSVFDDLKDDEEEVAVEPGQVDPNDPLLNPTMGQEVSAFAREMVPAAGAAALNFLQGPTLGWSDELMGLVPGGDRLEQFRQERNQVYPDAGMLAEGAGAITTGVMAGPRIAAQMARVGSPLAAGVLDTAAAGTAAGLYSAGTGEPGSRLEDVPRDSAIGAAFAPLAGLAGRVGSAAWDPVSDHLKNVFRTTEGQASSAIGRRMAREGVPTDLPAQQAREGEVAYPDPAEVPYINADTDPVQAQQLKELYDRNPSARGPIDQQLTARQRTAPQRVVSDIADITDLPRDARQGQAELLAQSKREMARQGYGALQDQTVPVTDEIFDMFTGPEAPDMRKAYINAEAIARREGNSIPPYEQIFGENGTLQDIPLTALDYMQRSFRNAGKPNIANPNYDNVSWRKLRERFLGLVDEASPEFKDVRRNWATATSLEEAANQGRDIYKLGDARDIADYMASLSGPEQQAFRRGALDAIEGQARNLGRKSGNMDTRLAGTQNKDEILDIVFGEKAEGVRQILQREDTFNNTFRQILGGSSTTKNLGDAVIPFKPGQGISEIATTAVGNTLKNALGAGPDVVEETIRQLTARGYSLKQAEAIARQNFNQYGPMRAGQALSGAAAVGTPLMNDLFFGE